MKEEVKAKTEVNGKKVEAAVTYDFGDDLDSFVAIITKKGGQDGNKIAHAMCRASGVITIQDVIRAGLKAGKSKADIQKEVDDYKFGVKKRGRSKAEKMRDDFENLNPDERKELLSRLTSGDD